MNIISLVVKAITALVAILEKAAASEHKKTEAKLVAASAMVTQANAHRAAARKGRELAALLGDLTK
jgi:hypothetical protein